MSEVEVKKGMLDAKAKHSGDGFQSRKYLHATVGPLLVLGLATFGWLTGKMDADIWSSTAVWLLGLSLSIYGVANSAEKYIQAKKK